MLLTNWLAIKKYWDGILFIFFSQLLLKPKFSCIEKIKTIGSTYMIASGLRPGKEEQLVSLNFFLWVGSPPPMDVSYGTKRANALSAINGGILK